MVVIVQRSITVQLEDSKGWVIPSDHIQHVYGKSFVKLAGSNYGFSKLVCYDIKGIKNMSVASSSGLLELQKLRNDAVPLAEIGKEQLFDQKAKKKKVEAGIICQFQLEAVEDCPGGVVQCLSASHPKADLVVLLDENTLDLCIKYIRALGVEPDKKRAYNNDADCEAAGSSKLIRMGNGRMARKLIDEDGKPKLAYVKKSSD
jgi:hypothetical protein